MADREKKRWKLKNWISREQQEPFRWNKKRFMGYHFIITYGLSFAEKMKNRERKL